MKKTSLIIVALLVAAGSLQAARITQTNTFAGTPNYSSALLFNKFDTLGGVRTLTNVTVSVFLLTDAQGGIGVDNDGALPASGTVTMGSKLTLSAAAAYGVALDPLSATTSAAFSLAADDGDGHAYSTSGPDYGSMNVTENQTNSFTIIGSTYWVNYQGAGSFLFDVTIDQIATYAVLGGVQALIDPMHSRGSVVVTYDYIPEPASAMLVFFGAGVGVVIHRARRAALRR